MLKYIKFKKVLITILTVYSFGFSQTSWANCPEDVQVITKGQAAPCDGILLSPTASKKVDEDQQDLKYYKSLSEKLQVRQDYSNKENEILDQRLKLYIDQSQTLASELSRQKNYSELQKYGYLLLGVIITGAVSKNINR